MQKSDLETYRVLLERDKDRLEVELDRLGHRNPKQAGDWETRSPDIDVMHADANESADRTEEYQIDSIVLNELEARYRNTVRALKKIEAGTFGVCEVSGEPIEEDRLRANPAARTAKAHLNEEDRLPQ